MAKEQIVEAYEDMNANEFHEWCDMEGVTPKQLEELGLDSSPSSSYQQYIYLNLK